MFKAQNRTNSSKVYAFNVRREKWEATNLLPSLNTPRHNLSACTIDDTVYVYGGSISDVKDLNTIEFLTVRSLVNGLYTQIPTWTTIEITELCARRCALLCQFPQSGELLIYGGHDGKSCVSDGVIFNTTT